MKTTRSQLLVLFLVIVYCGTASAAKVTRLAKLSATNVDVGFSIYGSAVAMDADTVVVGSPDPFLYLGSAYVFVKPSNGWHSMTQTAQLVASDGVRGSLFGNNVAVRGDVVAVSDYGQNQNRGKIYVYVKPPGGWSGILTETAQLTASDDNFGYLLGRTLAMDSEGTIYGGAPLAGNGTVYVFTQPAGGWQTGTQKAELTSSHGISLAIASQALTADGASATVVAGAAGWPSGFSGQDYGAAFMWVKPATGWVSASEETALILASDHKPFDLLGDAVALSGDTLIVGAPGMNGEQGGGYAYSKPATGWASTAAFAAKLTAQHLQNGYALGNAAAVTGTLTILGADGYLSDEGALYLYGPPPKSGGAVRMLPLWLVPDPLNQSFAFFGNFIAAQGNLVAATAYLEQPVGGVYVMLVE
ncbi:MAG: putative cell wall-anchored protein [Edaphobacter sp.]|nr:putative cell wall-anchored protein [Edaphobacter sp.]